MSDGSAALTAATPTMTLTDLRTKIYADGAELDGMRAMYREPHIKGFTTNPTLMRKAGIADYRAFARQVVAAIPDRPISFEVFSDEFDEMERQAREITTWGSHVYVKIPVTNRIDNEGDGFRVAMNALNGGRITIAATACGTTNAR